MEKLGATAGERKIRLKLLLVLTCLILLFLFELSSLLTVMVKWLVDTVLALLMVMARLFIIQATHTIT